MRQFLSTRFDKSSRFGNFAIVLFVILQVLDGVLTYRGLSLGLAGEGNPLVRILISIFGLGFGLAVAKGMAAICGVLLYVHKVYSLIAVLDVIYIVLGIVPWTVILFWSF